MGPAWERQSKPPASGAGDTLSFFLIRTWPHPPSLFLSSSLSFSFVGTGSLVTQAGLEFSVWQRMTCFYVLGAGSVDV